jgi:hypothetical protein
MEIDFLSSRKGFLAKKREIYPSSGLQKTCCPHHAERLVNPKVLAKFFGF